MKSRIDGKAFVIGRIVHYVYDDKKSQLPMLITRCSTEMQSADGVVFGLNSEGITCYNGVPYSKERKIGTWHFPSMAFRDEKKKPAPGQPLRVLTAGKK